METKVRRIDLSTVGDIETALQNLCANMGTGGYRLVTTFVYNVELVLIFQK
jgi:hypothetical protein